MWCISCGCDKTKVTDSAKTKTSVLRERACLRCGIVFYTEETAPRNSIAALEVRDKLRYTRAINRGGKERQC